MKVIMFTNYKAFSSFVDAYLQNRNSNDLNKHVYTDLDRSVSASTL